MLGLKITLTGVVFAVMFVGLIVTAADTDPPKWAQNNMILGLLGSIITFVMGMLAIIWM